MKKTIAITSALAAVTSLATAEIKINDFLSLEGFVDMSYSHTDIDSNSGLVDSDTENSYDIDQVEIDWLFSFDKVTARIDLAHEGSDSSFDTDVEQAYVTYDLGNGSAITAGRYQSMLGLEAFEPTGLYQYSFAYDMGVGSVSALPGYAGGVKYTRESGDSFFGVSIQDQTAGTDAGRLGGDDGGSIGAEVAFSTQLSDGVTWFLGGAYEDVDGAAGAEDTDTWVVNTYVTYEADAWTYGAELNYGESDINGPAEALTGLGLTDEETLQGLIMANYAYNECCSITGRISYSDHEADGGAVEADFTKYTLAHNYAVSDNLLVVTEISFVDGELDGDDVEATVGAVEVLFSF